VWQSKAPPSGANFAPDAVFGENKQLYVAQKSFLHSQRCHGNMRGNMIVAQLMLRIRKDWGNE